MASTDPIEIDGRTLEGGGQLIRMSLCLAALTSTPIKITNIRGNRSGGGGLKAQHLACVKWLAYACNAHIEGAEKGSKTLLFQPGTIAGGLSPAFKKVQPPNGTGQRYESRLDIGTAGSTGLALQAILPFILFSKRPSNLPVLLHISGGTNVSGSPSYDYIQHILLPTLSRIGLPTMTPTLSKRGWSQGGSSIGTWTLEIPPLPSPLPLPQFTLSPPSQQNINIHALLLAPSSVHTHFSSLLPSTLSHHFPTHTLTTTLLDSEHPKRLYLLLHTTFPTRLGADWLFERKISSPERAITEMIERVSNHLAEDFYSGACVDEHLRDQLVIFQALAQGKCEVYAGREEEGEGELREPSLHARTAEWVARKMLGVRFDSEGVCEGVAFGGGVKNAVEKRESLKVE